jgi:hypothetical protein
MDDFYDEDVGTDNDYGSDLSHSEDEEEFKASVWESIRVIDGLLKSSAVVEALAEAIEVVERVVCDVGALSQESEAPFFATGAHTTIFQLLVRHEELRLPSTLVANLVYCVWCMTANPSDSDVLDHMRR